MFQELDLPAQRRLRHVHARGRAAEMRKLPANWFATSPPPQLQ
jgi:hypothetical protein